MIYHVKSILIALAAIFLSAVILLFFKRGRKYGLITLTILILSVAAFSLWFFIPRHYKRHYLQQPVSKHNYSMRSVADSLQFYIGAIPGGLQITDSLFLNTFNSITLENEHKWGSLLKGNTVGQYDFSRADSLVNLALAYHFRVRGHTLVWGRLANQFKSPDLEKWLSQYPENKRPPMLKKAMQEHIKTVLEHYKGKIKVWDVINEPTDLMNTGKLDNNVYYKYLGENYIADALTYAHSIDSSIKLYINEQIVEYDNRQANSFINLITKLKQNNVPLHGIGLQTHIFSKMDTSINHLSNYIRKFTELGLEVEITELDMRLRLFNKAKDPYATQGDYYERLATMCLQNPQCKGITFWGTTDNMCWMDNIFYFPKPYEPYFFDAERNTKPAYYGILKALNNKKE